MAWIESHQTLLTHRKTGRLARALDISKITAIGHLHAFWWWCLDNAPDGDLRDIDAADIADGACWEGDPDAFLAALIHAGFVDAAADGAAVHEWMDYAGKLIEQRKAHAERMRNARRHPKPPAPPPGPSRNGHEPIGDMTRDEHVTSTFSAREAIPYSTVPNNTVEIIPPTPQPPEPAVNAAANAAGAATPPPKGKKPRTQPAPKPGFDYPLLWRLVEEAQGYKPTWNYAVESKAINRLLGTYPSAQPADFARFLAYVGTCWPWCDEPTRQPTFSEGAKHFGAWYTNGQPACYTAPEKQRSQPHGQRQASTSSDRERDKLVNIAAYLAS